jgi:hypothetical protein
MTRIDDATLYINEAKNAAIALAKASRGFGINVVNVRKSESK